MEYILDIPGTPHGKARPRVTRRGITYTPKQTKDAEDTIRRLFDGKYPVHADIKQAVRASIEAVFPIPKSTPKHLRENREAGSEYPCVKPDGDNIAKLMLDALNGYAYTDDSCVVSLTVSKRYTHAGEEPHTIVQIHDA